VLGNPASFLYPALKTSITTVNPATGQLIGAGESAIEPEYFEVRGDYYGIIPIRSAIFRSDVVVSGGVATGEIILTFFEPLPDDRYTLIIRDRLTDHSGNALDGEMDTIEPEDSTTLQFPSGDFIPGDDSMPASRSTPGRKSASGLLEPFGSTPTAMRQSIRGTPTSRTATSSTHSAMGIRERIARSPAMTSSQATSALQVRTASWAPPTTEPRMALTSWRLTAALVRVPPVLGGSSSMATTTACRI